MKDFTFKCYRFLNGGETKEHCLFFNSYHIHIGICIEGTSMHLNCLHDKWKAVLSSGKETKVSENIYGCQQPHSHSTYTHPCTHTQDTKHHKQALHETFDRYKVIRSTIKLHTVHHTTEDLSQRMAFTWERKFQRTLAVKQPGVSRVLR